MPQWSSGHTSACCSFVTTVCSSVMQWRLWCLVCSVVGRVYDVAVTSDEPVTTVLLCSTSVDAETKVLSPSRHLIALGDTAVSFDFGEPVDMGPDVHASRSRYLWPIYVLLGNGEVYRLITSVDIHRLAYQYSLWFLVKLVLKYFIQYLNISVVFR